jgi:hypothetical protein
VDGVGLVRAAWALGEADWIAMGLVIGGCFVGRGTLVFF